MHLLSEHIKETIDRAGGYLTGNLVVEDGKVFLEKETQNKHYELMELNNSCKIEVRSGNEYKGFSIDEILELKTDEGWSLLAGLYCRVKK